MPRREHKLAAREAADVDTLTPKELLLATRVGLVERVRGRPDGSVVYELTHLGRVLLGRAQETHEKVE